MPCVIQRIYFGSVHYRNYSKRKAAEDGCKYGPHQIGGRFYRLLRSSLVRLVAITGLLIAVRTVLIILIVLILVLPAFLLLVLIIKF